MNKPEILLQASFDPKLRVYWFWSGVWILAVSVIGILILPFWFLGLGQLICARRFVYQRAALTSRTLHIQSGYWFKIEKHVPLDKIQDISLREGPLLRALGLASLSVETAGQSQDGGSDASLSGLMDAVAFRDAVLAQRDRLAGAVPSAEKRPEELEILLEIRDLLRKIADRGSAVDTRGGEGA